MATTAASILIFASPGASAFSGSRTDAEQSRSTVPAQTALRGSAFSDPSADYWHALAVKRLHLLAKRERRIVALLVRIHKLRAAQLGAGHHRSPARSGGTSPAKIICSVFGAHCSEAISVATCESHLNVYARNGQYWGIFQEGEFARASYGFGWTVLAQAQSAYRYFLDAGWSPWQCRP